MDVGRWALLFAGPVVFFLEMAAVSAWLSARKVPPGDIPGKVSAFVPHYLVGMFLCLAVLLLFQWEEARKAWAIPDAGKVPVDAAIGVGAGVAMAFLYLHGLAPLLTALQKHVGDYVPPGSVLPAVSGSLVLFFLANVLCAPLLEETIYRGIAIPGLAARWNGAAAVALSCLLFGLLHWAGGVWYMAVTGLAAGGLFAGLFLWRGSLVAPFCAHLALNAVEFLHAARASR